MTLPEDRPSSRPHPRLVLHDIELEKQCRGDRAEQVVALVECERRGTRMSVDACRCCERFAFVEPHEAGYALYCRSTDEEITERVARTVRTVP